MGELKRSKTGIDGRCSERWKTYLCADVSNGWKETSEAIVTNISYQGLRLEGSRKLVDIVFPNFQSAPTDSESAIHLRLVLEEGAQLTDANSVSITCRSVYVLREKPNWFQIGLYYQHIEAGVADKLETFITKLQRLNKPSQ